MRITEDRVIAIARRLDPGHAGALAKALVAGGIHVLEITMDSPDPATAITRAADHLTVGAGTVMTIDDCEAAVRAGATFLVSPHTAPHLIEWGVHHDVPVIPGAFTPTEVVTAHAAGAVAVKLFPISVGGPALIREIRGPLPHIPLIPSGGVTDDNAAELLAAGAAAVGVGSWLTGPTDLDVVTERARLLRSSCGDV
jgi:2-dehydro-3-deoxyphosphogluconate aldolase/(4S)-4-hydroxy-2-oxoglutarate aldolase